MTQSVALTVQSVFCV